MKTNIELTDDIATCRALRREVFIDEQGISEADEIDALDTHCLHLLAFVDDAPAGTARIMIKDGIAKIGRVCVVSSHRGTGLGKALISACMEVSRAKGSTARLGAQLQALGFYEALGFTAVGPVYDDAGIDHRDMVCDL
jgi:ElaA protein